MLLEDVMKKTILIAPVLMVLTGCETVSWLQPLYSPDDIIQDEAVAGKWSAKDGDTVTIAAEGDGYTVTLEDKKGEKTAFTCYLVRTGGELYADLSEKNAGIPDHMLVRIELSSDQMTWFTLDSDWLKSRVKDGTLPTIRIAEGRKDTRWVVNLAPEEARRMLRSYRYQAWEEAVKLERTRPTL